MRRISFGSVSDVYKRQDGKNMLQIKRGDCEDYISAESLVECIHGLPVKSIEFFTAENHRKEAWSRVLHRTLKAQRRNLRRHLVSRPAPSDVLLGLQYNICLLERYRSNMWYRPEQNERMQRSSAPVSSSSCSGFFIFQNFLKNCIPKWLCGFLLV